jgi:hypothetical protein
LEEENIVSGECEDAIKAVYSLTTYLILQAQVCTKIVLHLHSVHLLLGNATAAVTNEVKLQAEQLRNMIISSIRERRGNELIPLTG